MENYNLFDLCVQPTNLAGLGITILGPLCVYRGFSSCAFVFDDLPKNKVLLPRLYFFSNQLLSNQKILVIELEGAKKRLIRPPFGHLFWQIERSSAITINIKSPLVYSHSAPRIAAKLKTATALGNRSSSSSSFLFLFYESFIKASTYFAKFVEMFSWLAGGWTDG